jgi:hypothetical protein
MRTCNHTGSKQKQRNSSFPIVLAMIFLDMTPEVQAPQIKQMSEIESNENVSAQPSHKSR